MLFVWFDAFWGGLSWSCSIWFDLSWCVLIWFDSNRSDSLPCVSIWFGVISPTGCFRKQHTYMSVIIIRWILQNSGNCQPVPHRTRAQQLQLWHLELSWCGQLLSLVAWGRERERDRDSTLFSDLLVIQYFSCMNLLADSSWSHRSFWNHLEPTEAIWIHLWSSGGVWTYLKPSGGIWRYLDLPGVIWRYLELLGAYLGHLEPCGAIWKHLYPSVAVLSYMDSSDGCQRGCHHMWLCGLVWLFPIRFNFTWCVRFDVSWFVLSFELIEFDLIVFHSTLVGLMMVDSIPCDRVVFNSIWGGSSWFNLLLIGPSSFGLVW